MGNYASGKSVHYNVLNYLPTCKYFVFDVWYVCFVQVPPEQFCDIIWAGDLHYKNHQCDFLAAYVAVCYTHQVCINWRRPSFCRKRDTDNVYTYTLIASYCTCVYLLSSCSIKVSPWKRISALCQYLHQSHLSEQRVLWGDHLLLYQGGVCVSPWDHLAPRWLTILCNRGSLRSV